ncbi:hypothetical protein JW992_06045 [candidate division KSB1 bacterium]|nr:hypothetical protein [candidate division KSB1 bacterium]
MKKHYAIIGLFLLTLVVSLWASEGKYAGSALELGLGARSLALGEAAVALMGDGPMFYYNPALIALTQRQMHLMYAPTFGSIAEPMAHYHHAGLVFPLRGQAAVAVNWTRFSVDEIPIYPSIGKLFFADRRQNKELRPTGEPLGYFTDTQDVYYFTFSKLWEPVLPLGWLFIDLPIQIPIGLNFKVFQESVYGHSASGLGVDCGTALRFSLAALFDRRALGDLSIGFSLSDITRTAIIWDTKHEDRIHAAMRLGIAYRHPLRQLHGDVGFYWTRYRKYTSHNLWGAEFQTRGLALRIGANRFGFTAGAGFRMWRLQVDYAFVTLDFDGVHRVSCNLNF